ATNRQAGAGLLSHADAHAESTLFVATATAHSSGTAEVRSTVESGAGTRLTLDRLFVHAESFYGLERRTDATAVTINTRAREVVQNVQSGVQDFIDDWVPWPLSSAATFVNNTAADLTTTIINVTDTSSTYQDRGGSGKNAVDTINLRG